MMASCPAALRVGNASTSLSARSSQRPSLGCQESASPWRSSAGSRLADGCQRTWRAHAHRIAARAVSAETRLLPQLPKQRLPRRQHVFCACSFGGQEKKSIPGQQSANYKSLAAAQVIPFAVKQNKIVHVHIILIR